MPQFIRAAGYKIYFWSNEKEEPIHFHATKGNPDKNDTKVWLLENGSFKLAHNKGRIPEKDLSKIFSTMQIYYSEYIEFWKTYMGNVKFYK
ncbi:MAG: DUF4160 domain-containing protein [Treponema sp.]|nr:DUF4160 domain-containing protein [Treponema sp.]